MEHKFSSEPRYPSFSLNLHVFWPKFGFYLSLLSQDTYYMALPTHSSWFHNPNNICFASNLQTTIHLGELYFLCCCFLPVTFQNISHNFALKRLQSMYQIWDVRGEEKNSSPWWESKFCHPSHIQSHHWLSFRLKITYTCLTILKVPVCTACANIKLLCIALHSRFIINLLSLKTFVPLYGAHQTLILISYQTSTSYKIWGIHAVGVHNFQRDETV
jgi:hypothetical protein